MSSCFPLISIIVPVYNAERYLIQCIDSILAQTFSNFELILIDDGSLDKSTIICDNYSKKDPRIKVLHQMNQGVTEARKLGINKAVANWITFVDADDKLYPHALETLWQYHNDAEIINASFYESNNKTWIHKKQGLMTKNEFIESLLYSSTYGVVYASLYKKDLFQDKRFDFGKDIKIGEDILMKIEVSQSANKILNTPDIVYWYRENQNSVMHRMICSPSYWNRYFKVRNTLIPNTLIERLEINDIKSLIKAAKNPNVPYKKEYFNIITQKIGQLIKKNGYIKDDDKEIFLRIVNYTSLFIIQKSIHYHIHIFLKKLFNKKIYEILD